MEIKSQNVNNQTLQNTKNGVAKQTKEPEVKFTDELKNAEQAETKVQINENNDVDNSVTEEVPEANSDGTAGENVGLSQQDDSQISSVQQLNMINAQEIIYSKNATEIKSEPEFKQETSSEAESKQEIAITQEVHSGQESKPELTIKQNIFSDSEKYPEFKPVPETSLESDSQPESVIGQEPVLKPEFQPESVISQEPVPESEQSPESKPIPEIYRESEFKPEPKTTPEFKPESEPETSIVLDFKSEEDDNLVSAMDDLTNLLSKLNQSEDNAGLLIKENGDDTDNNKKEGDDLINNDFSIDNKDKLPPMMPNMNFGGDGQPFSSFMNNGENTGDDNGKSKLSSSAKELAEEAAILSTMAENIAIANKNIVIDKDTSVEDTKPAEIIIQNEEGIKKVDAETNIVKEVVVKYDTVVMNEADVEVFANLVDGKEVNLNNPAPEAMQKSVQVSKTLSEMLAKAMEDNKPVRIEFDNGISVIIKISRDGKLSADFLPSTQVAEAYLKENLPILRQRFSEQNLDNEGLNQRERRNREREQDRRKGQDNE